MYVYVTSSKCTMDFFRKFIGLILFCVALAGFQSVASAQPYPNRPIKIINTFPAGGSGDTVLRVVFEKVGQALGQPFVIETRVGAAGAIGTAYVAKSQPDGYTFVLGTASTFGTNSQPYYVLVDTEGKQLVAPQAFNLDINNYIRFLDSGKAAFNKK
jgi:tripartite-type tricarboxylate transporter receptor subunit TctC